MLLPRKGRFGLVDYEKAFSPDLKNGGATSSTCAASTAQRARWSSCAPTSTSANVLPLDAHDALAAFFGQFLLECR